MTERILVIICKGGTTGLGTLRGQVAIVTGGGRGIERAMAQEPARAGAAVAVVARSEDQLIEMLALIEGSGGRAIALPADVTDQQAVERAVAETEDRARRVVALCGGQSVGWTAHSPASSLGFRLAYGKPEVEVCSPAITCEMVVKRPVRL